MMKTIKALLIASGLTLAAVAVSAQEAAPAAQLSDFSVGDTIVIKKDHERYLTGEKMSKWVYNVEHTIQQVGGRRWPNGILIRGIYSWVGPDDIINKSTHPEAAASNQEAKQQAEQARQDSIQAVKDSVEQARIDAARADSIAKAQQDSLRQARRDSIETARLDSIAERARRDSIAQAVRDSLGRAWEQQKDSAEAAYIITEPQKENLACDRFTIGLRGGAASLMQDAEKMGKWHIGWDALLDLQYAHYWKKFGKKMQYGLLVGVSAGYSRSHMSNAIDDKFQETTVSGANGETSVIDYNVKADNVTEYDGQIQLEIPLMFSMIHEKGFFMNIGPRFMLPVYAQYNQTIDNPVIDAYFATEGVNVHNARITGQVTDEQAKTNGKWKASTLNIMLGAELGYEFTFRNKNALGIGLYADYSVYTLYKNEPTAKSLVSIAELPGVNKPAVVNVLSATDSYAKGLGFFDVGLKLAYHFNWWKAK